MEYQKFLYRNHGARRPDRKHTNSPPVADQPTKVRPMPGALLTAILLTLGTTFPQAAPACGWWGDSELSASREAAVVYSGGQTSIGGRFLIETPEQLTRQANRLRRLGVPGHAGAVRLYRQATESGYPPAQNNLGAMYEQGLGVAPDLAEAARWYRLAAGQGEASAQHSIGMLLIAGNGVERDMNAGIHWLEKSARQGHAPACADLGRLYASGGEHLERDEHKAMFWWQQAKRYGHPAAAEALRVLPGTWSESNVE
jgi:hypothetical protein